MLEKGDFKSHMPLHFPFSKGNGKRTLANRFDSALSPGNTAPRDVSGSSFDHFDSLKTDRFYRHQYETLQGDLQGREVVLQAEERLGQQLESQRQRLVEERKEFEHQQQAFTQKEVLKALQKKETMVANREYWEAQADERQRQRGADRSFELYAPYKYQVLEKIFRYNDLRHPKMNAGDGFAAKSFAATA